VLDCAFTTLRKIFGIIAVSRVAETEKSFDSISALTVEYLRDVLSSAKTFKVETKRADKRFPMKSDEVSKQLGGVILSHFPHLKVNVHTPEVLVKCEIRDDFAYIGSGQKHGAGGMPVGSNGKGMLLLSGGIDSPVAGWMMAKRGVKLDAVYFEAFPYTSLEAREKVIKLAEIVAGWAGSIRLHIVSLTEIEEEIAKSCTEDYFTLLLRRFMMTIAERLAVDGGCGALITGESMGQVASQTMQALAVTNSVTTIPVFRPCIGLDKEEIVTFARRVGSFETSILPFEDCCTVFTPKHPKTKPELSKVIAEEEKLDFDALVERAIATDEVISVRGNYSSLE
jgi:thiamine biosynthesis protein ThiI